MPRWRCVTCTVTATRGLLQLSRLVDAPDAAGNGTATCCLAATAPLLLLTRRRLGARCHDGAGASAFSAWTCGLRFPRLLLPPPPLWPLPAPRPPHAAVTVWLPPAAAPASPPVSPPSPAQAPTRVLRAGATHARAGTPCAGAESTGCRAALAPPSSPPPPSGASPSGATTGVAAALAAALSSIEEPLPPLDLETPWRPWAQPSS